MFAGCPRCASHRAQLGQSGSISREGGEFALTVPPPHSLPLAYLPIVARLTSLPVLSHHQVACWFIPSFCRLLEDLRQECSPLPPHVPSLVMHIPLFVRSSPSFKTNPSCFPSSQSPLFCYVIYQVLIDSTECYYLHCSRAATR